MKKMSLIGCIYKCWVQVANVRVVTTVATKNCKQQTEVRKTKKEALSKSETVNAFMKVKAAEDDHTIAVKDSKKI